MSEFISSQPAETQRAIGLIRRHAPLRQYASKQYDLYMHQGELPDNKKLAAFVMSLESGFIGAMSTMLSSIDYGSPVFLEAMGEENPEVGVMVKDIGVELARVFRKRVDWHEVAHLVIREKGILDETVES